jgi:hypothetical protein
MNRGSKIVAKIKEMKKGKKNDRKVLAVNRGIEDVENKVWVMGRKGEVVGIKERSRRIADSINKLLGRGVRVASNNNKGWIRIDDQKSRGGFLGTVKKKVAGDEIKVIVGATRKMKELVLVTEKDRIIKGNKKKKEKDKKKPNKSKHNFLVKLNDGIGGGKPKK